MVDRIVVLSDGTGNSSSKAQKTNVWRIFQALVPSSDQVAKYDDGVGTSTNKYLAILGGVFGWGLKRNVISLYCFICRHYPDINDEQGNPIPGVKRPDIHGFGFSRGSFTIRTLVGLINREGLVTWRNEDELRANAVMAYRSFRAKSFPASNVNWAGRGLVASARWLRDALLRWRPKYDGIAADAARRGRNPGVDGDRRVDGVSVRFLGLFDTVEAYGMPIAELKTGIDRYLWPMSFCNLDLPKIVDHARHALALDEERATFQPYQWDEELESQMIKDGLVPAGRLKQVWFAGVHSNVGGGYPEDQLSYVPLEWMMHEAIAQGLILDPLAVAEIERSKSALARKYDSRSGAGAYWRYGPRGTNLYSPQGDHHADRRKTDLSGVYGKPADNPTIKLDVNGVRIRPVVHHSVLTRMRFDDGYASAALPGTFWVMDPDGVITPFGETPGATQQQHGAVELDLTKPSVQFGATPAGKPAALLQRERDDLASALTGLTPPGFAAVKLVWDSIWWRRALTLAVAMLTFFVLLAPAFNALRALIGRSLPGGLQTSADLGNEIAAGPISLALGLFRAAIPAWAMGWVDAFVEHPLTIFLLAGAILMCLHASNLMQSRIIDRVRVGWNHGLRKQYLVATKDADAAVRNKFGALTAVFTAVTLGLTAATIAGYVEGWSAVWQSLYVTIAFALIFVWRCFAHRTFVQAVEHPATVDPDALPETALLKFASSCRTNPTSVKTYDWLSNTVTPGAFAVLVVVLAIVLFNQLAFIGANSAGAYCREQAKTGESLTPIKGDFPTNDPCWASGTYLAAGHHYEISLHVKEEWFDRKMRADVGGVWDNSVAHVLAWPLKRWLFEPYFRPIARIGRYGNDEFALVPARSFDNSVTREQCSSIAVRGWPFNPITAEEAAALASCAPTLPERMTMKAYIKPRTSGELFLYVNDAAWFFKPGLYYHNNRGTADISIRRVDDEPLYPASTAQR